jgi:hypothetical protein
MRQLINLLCPIRSRGQILCVTPRGTYRASQGFPTIVEPNATTKPTNSTISRVESTPGFDTTTSVQQTRESMICLGNHFTEHDETSDSNDEILTYSLGEMHSPGEFDLNSTVMTSMLALSSSLS